MKDGMPQEKTLETSPELKRPLAVRALRRSNVRKKIAEYLFDISPNYSYTSEIAYHVRTTPSNVIGAIRGMETRYREEESLLNLNIIEEKQCGKNVRLYSITDFGKEMLKTIKDRR
jgi:predicted transcriptional regulator with HTH domain